jgi:large subunit ribosomal protein L9
MRLLLLEDVRRVGHIGDIIEVSSGYARNYLLPQRLATEPTDENIKAIEDKRRAAAAQRARHFDQFKELAARLTDVSVTIEATANPEGTLYGSVGPKDIAAALQTRGFPVLPEHVMLPTPIRTLDNRLVTLEFAEDVTAQVKVWVVREGATGDGDDAGQPEQAESAEAED